MRQGLEFSPAWLLSLENQNDSNISYWHLSFCI